jgi:hypothetical protein
MPAVAPQSFGAPLPSPREKGKANKARSVVPEIVQDLAPGMLEKAMGLLEAKHGQFKGVSDLMLAQEVLFPMADYIDAVLKRIKGLSGGEELLNIVSLQDMIDEPMAKLILDPKAMDRGEIHGDVWLCCPEDV